MSTNVDAEITLTCSIVGLGNQNPFEVEILPSKTVDRLKKAIKKENEPMLDHINATQLTIWKVGDPARRRTRH